MSEAPKPIAQDAPAEAGLVETQDIAAPSEAINPNVTDQGKKSTTGKNDWGKIVSFSVGEIKIYRRLKQAEVSDMDDTTSLLYVAGEASRTDFPEEISTSNEQSVPVDNKTNYLKYMSSLLDRLSGGSKKFTPEKIDRKLGRIATNKQQMVRKDGFMYELQYTSLLLLADGAGTAIRPKATFAESEETSAASAKETKIPKPHRLQETIDLIEEAKSACELLACELGDDAMLEHFKNRHDDKSVSELTKAEAEAELRALTLSYRALSRAKIGKFKGEAGQKF